MKLTKNNFILKTKIPDPDRMLSFGIAFSFFALFLQNFLHYLTFIPPNSIFMNSAKILLTIVYLMCIPSFFKRINVKSILIVLISFSFILFNLFFEQNKEFFLQTILTFLLNCFLPFLFSIILKEGKYLYIYFYKLSILVSILITVALITNTFHSDGRAYAMGLSYAAILFFIILLDDFLKNKKKYSIIMGIPIIYIITIFGSRGAFACVGMYILVYLYRNFRFNREILKTLFFVLFFILLFIFRNQIINIFASFLNNIGIYSRSVQLLLEGEFVSSDGRLDIYTQLINDIVNNPLAIRGVNAEYNVVNIYAHNFIIEILYQFGIIIGSIINGFIIYIVIKAMNMSISHNIDSMTIIFLSVWFPYLLLSSSIWITNYFWVFLGIYLNRNLNNSYTSKNSLKFKQNFSKYSKDTAI